jgi:hypothetical protein
MAPGSAKSDDANQFLTYENYTSIQRNQKMHREQLSDSSET